MVQFDFYVLLAFKMQIQITPAHYNAYDAIYHFVTDFRDMHGTNHAVLMNYISILKQSDLLSVDHFGRTLLFKIIDLSQCGTAKNSGYVMKLLTAHASYLRDKNVAVLEFLLTQKDNHSVTPFQRIVEINAVNPGKSLNPVEATLVAQTWFEIIATSRNMLEPEVFQRWLFSIHSEGFYGLFKGVHNRTYPPQQALKVIEFFLNLITPTLFSDNERIVLFQSLELSPQILLSVSHRSDILMINNAIQSKRIEINRLQSSLREIQRPPHSTPSFFHPSHRDGIGKTGGNDDVRKYHI